MIKNYNIKKYSLIVLQALSAVLVSACICIYSFYSRVQVRFSPDEVSVEKLSLLDFKANYYDSDNYSYNLLATVDDIARYSVIKSQLETDGKYDPDKIIFIGEYTHRADSEPYNGPDAAYYLKDLIAWGQFGISTNGISHSYKVFDSWEEFNSFFGQNEVNKKGGFNAVESTITYEITSEEDGGVVSVTSDVDSDTVPMLDVISNRYLSCQGQNLEYYAANSEDYAQLVYNLEDAAISLYTNYMTYLEFEDRYNPDNTNIRFYVSVGSEESDIFTNLLNFRLMDPQKLSETFKALGEYIYACPQSIDFLTNTPLQYDNVKASFMDYSYFYPDNTIIWVGLDTSYPVEDLFYSNYYNQTRSLSNVPWVISFAAIGLVSFIGLMVMILVNGRKRYLSLENKELKFLDKAPIESELLLCALIIVIIYLFKLYLSGDGDWEADMSLRQVLLPNIVTTFLYTFTGLMFFYSIVKRGYLHQILNTSIIVAFLKWFDKRFSFVKKWFWKMYDSGSVAIRTWTVFLAFLIFNTFWACMLFFSSMPVLSFLILLLFDGAAGIILFNRSWERKRIIDAIKMINEGDFEYKIDATKMHGDNKSFADTVNKLGDSIKMAVEQSSKDEKLKADLITNVSHDIKTPLTSIINYVDLLRRENIDNDRVNNYLKILDEKSQRLKQLTVDLVEASKITSGNITLEVTRMNVIELINQAEGEFEEKYASRGLKLVTSLPGEPVIIEADPRYIWRVLENLLQNAYKYALQDTRVYLDVAKSDKDNKIVLSVKNISAQQLNISADELTERFIRGDVARSTEGSGLGLSIVKSLVRAHNGSFDIYLDGDLFKATVTLPMVRKEEQKDE